MTNYDYLIAYQLMVQIASQQSISQSLKTRNNKATQHHPQTPHESTKINNTLPEKSCIDMSYDIWHVFQTNPSISPPPHRYVSPHENQRFFPHLHSPHNLASLNLANLARDPKGCGNAFQFWPWKTPGWWHNAPGKPMYFGPSIGELHL